CELGAATTDDAPATEVPISVDDVSKVYSANTALNNVSASIPRGSRWGLVGGSGSGKSTLIKMIAGLTALTSGDIDVAGSVQMVFQAPQGSLDPRMSVGKIIAEGLPDKCDASAKVAEVLRAVGLKPEHASRYPHEFSGGQRQRISIA